MKTSQPDALHKISTTVPTNNLANNKATTAIWIIWLTFLDQELSLYQYSSCFLLVVGAIVFKMLC